jgi:hypothetical protein
MKNEVVEVKIEDDSATLLYERVHLDEAKLLVVSDGRGDGRNDDMGVEAMGFSPSLFLS